MLFFTKKKPDKAIAKLLNHVPRAYGDEWQEVTYRLNPATGVVEKDYQPAEAPAEQKPILVIGNTGLSDSEMDFILAGARKTQEYWSRDKKRKPSDKEIWWMVNTLFQEYNNQLVAAGRRISQFGPKGKTQR